MPPEGRRGSRTPKALAGPPVFETGYRARGSPSSGAGRRRTCNLPIKSRVLCRVELRSQVTWPAGIEPAAPRVSSGRSTAELQPHGVSGQGWNRTSDLLFVRQALVPTELLALGWTGRESNPRTTAPFAAATTTTRLLCRTLSYPAHGSGTRNRTSTSRFRAWRPAG
jgi:hypothetical protein